MTGQIVKAARQWIGTPYVHQASCLGAGCDCLGLVRGVWRQVFGAEPEPVPAYSLDWSETGPEELLWQAAMRHLGAKPIGDTAPGDVLLFRLRESAVAKHLGVQAETGDTPTFIHAYSGHRVTESPFSRPWERRLVARFAFPDMESLQ